MTRRARLARALLLASVFTVSFEKLHWSAAESATVAHGFAAGFVIVVFADRVARADWRISPPAAVTIAFLGVLLPIWLAGFFSVETRPELELLGKGLLVYLLHFAFLASGIAFLARAGTELYWRTVAWFTAGLAANSAYGFAQLAAARTGHDLDRAVLTPLSGPVRSINLHGAVEGIPIYRPNALTGDPNHLGIMLIVPLLTLTPLYLRLERGNRFRLPLALVLTFLLAMELVTLSRSGVLGLVVGVLVLALAYRRLLIGRAVMMPLAAIALVVGTLVARQPAFYETLLRSRVDATSQSSAVHLTVYEFIPDALRMEPLFGLGLNTFSAYYEAITGRSDFGPHSFYVALLVETGLVGTLGFAIFLRYLFITLRRLRRLGRTLAAQGVPLAIRVRPLAWGLTAALVGTMAANVFYLTMQFFYFYVLALLTLAAGPAFRRAC